MIHILASVSGYLHPLGIWFRLMLVQTNTRFVHLFDMFGLCYLLCFECGETWHLTDRWLKDAFLMECLEHTWFVKKKKKGMVVYWGIRHALSLCVTHITYNSLTTRPFLAKALG